MFILPFLLGIAIYNLTYARLYFLLCSLSILITALWSHFRMMVLLICNVLIYIPLLYLYMKSKQYYADNVELILKGSKSVSVKIIFIVALTYIIMFILIVYVDRF